MDKREAIINVLSTANKYDLVQMWNQRCEDERYYDDTIEMMDSLDELWSGWKPTEIIERIGNDFYVGDDFYAFDGYGRAQSFSYLNAGYSPYDEDTLADYLEGNTSVLAEYFEPNDLWDDFIEFITDNIEEDFCDFAILDIFNKDEENPDWDIIVDDWDELLDRFKELIKKEE